MVKISVGLGGDRKTFCWCGWDLSTLIQGLGKLFKLSAGVGGTGQTRTGGLVNPSAGIGGVGQTFSWSGWDWSNFLLEWVGLVKYFVVVGRIGQTLCGNRRNWSKFL